MEANNIKAMRKALEQLYEQICFGWTERNVVANRQMILDALSDPPRNCDMPVVDGPADDKANRAWLVFKHNNPDAYFDVPGLMRCIDWLLSPALARPSRNYDEETAEEQAAQLDGMTFGQAIEAMKQGKKVARKGWNGKGMYLWILPAASVKAEWCKEPHLKMLAEQNGGEVECLGSVRMKTADGKVLTGWLASQTDMLSDDWQIVD